jgi:putative ABC transport system permease protein
VSVVQAPPISAPVSPNGVAEATPVVAATPDWEIDLEPLSETATDSMAISQSLASALEALRSNRVRAFLTMLGVIIGVGAVIVMVALGQGAAAAVQSRLTQLGTNLLTITPGSASGGGVRTGAGGLPTLTELDAQAIQQQISNVAMLSPNLSMGNVQVVAGNQNWNTQVQANYPTIFGLQSYDVADGAAFDDTDEASGAQVADIGETVATNLFGDAEPVGQRILIRNAQFIVKGVLARKGSNGFRDQDDIILVPFRTAQARLFNSTFVNSIYVQVADASDVAEVQSEIVALLETRHHIPAGHPDDFRIQNNNQIVQTAQSTSDTLTSLLAGAAAVSLVVGGIGIMNIMLVSVRERTREIGIRLAIGARAANILSQFLIEAIVLSVIGGVIGIVLGGLASAIVSHFAGWPTVITGSSVLLAFGFSAAVGTFFGYYPARKASQLDPIDALHYE